LGGRLVAAFLCGDCNSKLGYGAEAAARADPTIQLLIAELSKDHPDAMSALQQGQSVVAIGPGGKAAGRLTDGRFVVKAMKMADGSLVQPTPDARRSIQTMLERKGADPKLQAEALARFDEAPENVQVALAPGLDIVKWGVAGVEPGLEGPLMDHVVPTKTAYEFLAGHLGTAIVESDPHLDRIRDVLAGGTMDTSVVAVERLHAPTARPFHGVIFEGNHPHARVQVRFFGKLAFRVHFRQLALGGPRLAYTHDLVTGEERVVQLDGEGEGDLEAT